MLSTLILMGAMLLVLVTVASLSKPVYEPRPEERRREIEHLCDGREYYWESLSPTVGSVRKQDPASGLTTRPKETCE